jgi:hypothetical protein
MSIEAIAARAGIILQPSGHQPKLDRLEWRLLTANSAIKSLDIYSTHRALFRGGKEEILPDAIAAHSSIFSLYDSGVIATEWLVARKVTPRHPRLAHWLTIADMAGGAACVVNNFLLPFKPAQTASATPTQSGPVIITNSRMKQQAGQSVSPRVRVGLTFTLSRRNPLAGSRAGMLGWNP